MISRIRGTLRDVRGTKVQIEIGPFWYEVLVPVMVIERLPALGATITLRTISFIEGAAISTLSTQRLLGFLEPVEREFFNLFTSVKDVGIRKALKAFNQPVSAIASAIERADIVALQKLPGIGPKASRQIVAELTGKVAKFALLREVNYAHGDGPDAHATGADDRVAAAAVAMPYGTDAQAADIAEAVPTGLAGVLTGTIPDHVADVRHVLVGQLNYKEAEADDLLSRALSSEPALAKAARSADGAEQLIQAVFKQSSRG